MLPSCGHFKNIPCPFYKFALCVRPHCPYKHYNAENTNQRQLFTPLADDTEPVFDSKNELDTIHKSYDTITENHDSASYVPTPVELNSKPPGILKTSSNVENPASSYVPEYKPTPISKLKEFTQVPVKASKSVYTPEFPVAVRKRKNVEEYDPTEVKCIPKKTVTFVDETSTVPLVQISSDEELDDNESAPKFSDDDSDEETQSVIKTVKEVPDVITIKEEPVEEKIDEFSVVDKILVDCKKNEMFLNSFKKIPPRTSSLSSKVQNHDENVITQSEKSEIKMSKSNHINSIKTEKNVSDDKMIDTNSSCKLKHMKDELLELVNSPSKVKNSEKCKKDSKSEKKEKNSEKEKSNEKEKKHSGSHSSHSKDKSKKEKESKSTHEKKNSHTQKSGSSDCKIIKSNKHLVNEKLGKKDSKKKMENHSVKQNEGSHSPNKKKSKHESTNSSKLSESHFIKFKKKNSSNDHSVKKKSVSDSDSERHSSKHSVKRKTVLDSDSERHSSKNSVKRKSASESDSEKHSSKNKSHHEEKKFKMNSNVSPPKHAKTIDSLVSDKLKPISDHCKITDNNKIGSNIDESDIDETVLSELLSSSESDPDEECRRIFEECYPEESGSGKQNRNEEIQQPKSSDASELVILRKKRYAHPAASEVKPPTKQAKTEIKRPLNPAQVMHNRFAQSQARFAQINEKKDLGKSTDKKRLSFIPNQNLLAAIKNKNQSNPVLENFSPLPPTVSKTLKVTQRTAHIPEAAKKPRPIIPAEYGSKVPPNIRQKFLNSFIDECLKFCLSEDEAYELALEEEKKVYDRSSSRPLYLNIAANALKRLRRRAEEGPETEGNNSMSSKSNSNQRTVSHEAVLNGPLAQRRSYSIGKKKEAPEIKGKAQLYEYLLEYVLTPEQLKENSYPLPRSFEKDRAVIEGAYANRTLYCNDAFKRMCSRCRKTYYVNVDGDYVRDEECDFHWGRLWKKRIAGSFESRYSCCQGDAESDGCCVSPGHVFEGSENHVLRGYVRTLPKTPPPDNCYGVYALDCEMCYTTAGIELTRVTVVDTDLKTVYESFVKPLNKVLDYNTRFSGITEDDLKNVRTTLIDVQAVLLCIFSDKSILIGHSLESDFKALKLFHSTVIDTSVVFPHKSGLPYKRALKTLMAEKLNKIIQNDVGGHDSHEDAIACMELMLWKVKEDIRGIR